MKRRQNVSALPAGTVRIHDDSQLEIKLDYLFSGKSGTSRYRLDLYFFIPVNFGIDERSYSRDAFYRDLFGYVRLKTPRSTMAGVASEFFRLKARFSASVMDDISGDCNAFDTAVRLSCCIFRTTLRDFTAPVRDGDIETASVPSFIEKVREARDHVRALADTARSTETPANSTIFHADEYTSLVAEAYVFRMLRPAQKADDAVAVSAVVSFLEDEREWRTRHFPNTVAKEESDNAPLVFRGRILKKFVNSILFLSTRKKRSNRWINQLLFAIGAGVSMLFATAVAFYFQDQFGQLTVPFLAALVVSYMFKDRFKDLFRFLAERLIHIVGFDYDTKILDGAGQTDCGTSRERVRFIEPGEVPEDILKARLPNTEVELSSHALGENIIHYEKRVRLSPGAIRNVLGDRIPGLNDIIRFNIQEFTRRLDDTTRPLYVLKDGEAVLVPARNHYAFHMIGKFTSDEGTEITASHITISKKGLVSFRPV